MTKTQSDHKNIDNAQLFFFYKKSVLAITGGCEVTDVICVRYVGVPKLYFRPQISEGYSGSDLQVACREASMGCLRKVFNVLEDHSGKTQAVERVNKWGVLSAATRID